MQDWGETEGRDVFEDAVERKSEVLGPDGEPFIVRRAKQRIGFRLNRLEDISTDEPFRKRF